MTCKPPTLQSTCTLQSVSAPCPQAPASLCKPHCKASASTLQRVAPTECKAYALYRGLQTLQSDSNGPVTCEQGRERTQ
jgi:hypothetical protein